RGPRGAPPAEELMRRRLIAAGIFVVLIVLIFLGLRSCADSRKERALKDYNRDVTQIASDSVDTTTQFFEQLNEGGSVEDLQSRLNQLRLTSEEQVKSARNLDVPGDMKRAQLALEMALNLRTTAIGRIASLIDDAASDNGQTAENAIDGIAGQMEAMLASDVLYSQRVQANIADALSDADIGGQRIVGSRSLPDLGWLDKNQVADVLDAKRAEGGRGASSEPAPGTHGHGLTSVAVGQTTLNTEGTNRIPAGGNPTFNVEFQNQGENDEEDVTVKVTIKPSSGRSIVIQKKAAETKAGSPAEINIPLGQAPPIGTPVTITVEVARVPGEKLTDNNRSTYTAIFNR
ncbi:MAG TPA: hypothetical protein VFZ89_03110, partial [Solirubrobacteraceae bacterium]